jgi:diguanylate cyclase
MSSLSFGNLSIKTKIFLFAACVIAAMVALAVYSSLLLQGNIGKIDGLRSGALQQATAVDLVRKDALSSLVDLYRIVSVATNETDAQKLNGLIEAEHKSVAVLEQHFAHGKESMAAAGVSQEDIASLDHAFKAYLDSTNLILQMAASNPAASTNTMLGVHYEFADAFGQLQHVAERLEGNRDNVMVTVQSSMEEGNKVFVLTTLAASILAVFFSLRVSSRISESARKEAMTDALTGVPNRKAFDFQMEKNVKYAAEHRTPLVLMMLDIDHFKKFNDSYGHQTGDQVLGLVAGVLMANVKGKDTPARYGGEEFAVMLPETPLKAGTQFADSLRRSLEGMALVSRTTNEKLSGITMSIGVAEFRSGETIAAFIARADAALYQAKKGGRNRVCVASDDPPPPQEGGAASAEAKGH